MTPPPTLLAVPNVSEGRDQAALDAIGTAFAAGEGVRLLDTHSDTDHHRAVFTLAAHPGTLADALLRGARVAVEEIEIGDGRGLHPHVGAIDVVPVVYLDDGARGAACAEALVVADRIGEELAVPVFLYGALTGDPSRTRAQLRRGGAAQLARRMRSGELRPDFGPREPHPGAGATLVAAREPLVAFNLQLEQPATVDDARTIAGLIREGGAEGLPGLRAIGVELGGCDCAGVDERRAPRRGAVGAGGSGGAPARRGCERGAGRARAAGGVYGLPGGSAADRVRSTAPRDRERTDRVTCESGAPDRRREGHDRGNHLG